jgi:hypothetical protein
MQVPGVLKVLLERLRNEITRLPAVKGFAALAHSKLDLGLDGALEPVIVSTVTVLRFWLCLTCVLRCNRTWHLCRCCSGCWRLREVCALVAPPAVLASYMCCWWLSLLAFT